jgi:sarcinarray family protein
MKGLITVLLLVLLFAMLPGESCGRSIKAYFNGQEATVSDVVIQTGMPFTVDLCITPDGEADVWAEIDEPGTIRAYDRLDGDALVPAVFKMCNASSPALFYWELAASGNWVDGMAPVNIYYQVNGRNSNNIIARGYFTVVDAYITSGTPPGDAVAATGENVEKTPGPGVLIALFSILAALSIGHRALDMEGTNGTEAR